MGPGGVSGGYRYSTLPATPSPIPRVHPSPTRWYPVLTRAVTAGTSARKNSAVGLISVRQLSLSTEISGFREFTEVYNLLRIDRIINHSVIPGNE